ncbi:MAG: hypothetical protein ACI9AV_002327, partial [Sediminicola sp.]
KYRKEENIFSIHFSCVVQNYIKLYEFLKYELLNFKYTNGMVFCLFFHHLMVWY